MYHDVALGSEARSDPRPQSAVSTGVGLVGLAGLAAWMVVARAYGLDGTYSALISLVACGVPMILWSVFVDRVHRNPSTGIDWSKARPLSQSWRTSAVKLAGLWATWAIIAAVYATGRWYWQGNYQFSMFVFQTAAPLLLVISVPYILWIDRYLVDPRDGTWAFGAWLLHTGDAHDNEAIFSHLRSWAVKGFFLAFMLSIVPGGFGDFVRADFAAVTANPVALAQWLITLMFVVDVALATVGYVLTLRPLDSHIRSATPYAAGWMAALICYPPFILMGDGGPLDYHPGSREWTYWLGAYPNVMALVGVVLVALTAIYAWATVAFGLRFSNLTHRGILTHGPYAWSRHPAYLSKNLFWWIAGLPFFVTTGSLTDAIRNTLLLACVSGVYYWRAKTEEWHLGQDPAYREYSAWMDRNAPVPRFFAWLVGK